jgi:hypothetical protein
MHRTACVGTRPAFLPVSRIWFNGFEKDASLCEPKQGVNNGMCKFFIPVCVSGDGVNMKTDPYI